MVNCAWNERGNGAFLNFPIRHLPSYTAYSFNTGLIYFLKIENTSNVDKMIIIPIYSKIFN